MLRNKRLQGKWQEMIIKMPLMSLRQELGILNLRLQRSKQLNLITLFILTQTEQLISATMILEFK